jgi:hypothetical protein
VQEQDKEQELLGRADARFWSGHMAETGTSTSAASGTPLMHGTHHYSYSSHGGAVRARDRTTGTREESTARPTGHGDWPAPCTQKRQEHVTLTSPSRLARSAVGPSRTCLSAGVVVSLVQRHVSVQQILVGSGMSTMMRPVYCFDYRFFAFMCQLAVLRSQQPLTVLDGFQWSSHLC